MGKEFFKFYKEIMQLIFLVPNLCDIMVYDS